MDLLFLLLTIVQKKIKCRIKIRSNKLFGIFEWEVKFFLPLDQKEKFFFLKNQEKSPLKF